MAKTVELYVILYDIEDDACAEILRKAVEEAVTLKLPYIASDVVVAEDCF